MWSHHLLLYLISRRSGQYKQKRRIGSWIWWKIYDKRRKSHAFLSVRKDSRPLSEHLHASFATTRTTFLYCTLYSWNLIAVSLLFCVGKRKFFMFFVRFIYMFYYLEITFTYWWLFWFYGQCERAMPRREYGHFFGSVTPGTKDYFLFTCEYNCTKTEAHSVFYSTRKRLLISCHDTSWYFTVISKVQRLKKGFVRCCIFKNA